MVVLMYQTMVQITQSLFSLGERVQAGDSVLLMRDFNTSMGNDGVIWRGVIGRNSLPNLNLNNILLMGFCAIHGLPITSTTFKHRVVQKCTYTIRYHSTLNPTSMTDFVIILSDLQPYVLQKRSARFCPIIQELVESSSEKITLSVTCAVVSSFWPTLFYSRVSVY